CSISNSFRPGLLVSHVVKLFFYSIAIKTSMKVANIIAGLILLAGMLAEANAQPLAFPGAEGFGKYATGGRGGQVVIVDNLNDDGPGSLRSAIEMKGPRIVVFRVSGTIGLESELEIKQGDLT